VNEKKSAGSIENQNQYLIYDLSSDDIRQWLFGVNERLQNTGIDRKI
jgi:hypothetical protein